jgi:hypothetical protein
MLLLSASWVAAQSPSPDSTTASAPAPAQTQSSPAGTNSQPSNPSTTQPASPNAGAATGTSQSGQNSPTTQGSPNTNAPDTATQNSTAPNQGSSGQNNPAGTPSQNDGAQSTTGAGAATSGSGSGVTGCRSGSPITGDYIVTDRSGTSYKLTGNLESVRTLIGKEVQVTGQEGVWNFCFQFSDAGSVRARQLRAGKQFNVTSATKVADNRQPVVDNPGPTARWKKKSGVVPASLQTASLERAGTAAGSGQTPAPLRAQSTPALVSPWQHRELREQRRRLREQPARRQAQRGLLRGQRPSAEQLRKRHRNSTPTTPTSLARQRLQSDSESTPSGQLRGIRIDEPGTTTPGTTALRLADIAKSGTTNPPRHLHSPERSPDDYPEFEAIENSEGQLG